MARTSIQDLSPEVLEQIFSFLDASSVVRAAKVCLQWQLLCQMITKTLCCNLIPSDVFVEIWEECGLQIPINFIKVKYHLENVHLAQYFQRCGVLGWNLRWSANLCLV